MDNQNIKRGIDFSNRVGEGKLSETYKKSLAWWRGGKLNKRTFINITFIFVINLLIVSPLFTRNVTSSFSNSVAFALAADIMHFFFKLNNDVFFSIVTGISLSFAPISFYLFVRKIALRHELTALIATLAFILPNPFFGYIPVFGGTVINGDAAHAVVFSYIPLFLLYVESFFSTGIPILALLASIGTAIIAIFSPFAAFNLLLIYPFLAIAEGFLGNLRIKIFRMIFLLIMAFGLSLWWYFPTFFAQGISLSHVTYTINKILSLFPLLIPIIPVFGALFFLVFDRRKRLKPIFIGLSLLIIYVMLYITSKDIMISGIFTPERYRLELTFAGALTFSIITIIIGETLFRIVFLKVFKKIHLILKLTIISIFSGIFAVLLYTSIHASRLYLSLEPMTKSESIGIGNIVRTFNLTDISTILVDLISLITFLYLFHIVRTYPSLRKKIKNA